MKLKVTSVIVVFSMCFTFSANLCAQQGEVIVRRYSMKDGLPDNGVTCVIQDHLGFLWLGTNSGLCRFDGNTFVAYNSFSNSTNSIRGNTINVLLEDKFGRIWIGHNKGLDILDPATGQVLFQWPDDNNAAHSVIPSIYSLRHRKDGSIIFTTTDLGLYLIDPENLVAKHIDGIPVRFGKVLELRDGSMIGTARQGIYHISADFRTVTHDWTNSASRGEGDLPFSILEDKKGRLWVGTNDGLKRINIDERSFTHYPFGRVANIFEKDNGNLLLACMYGLYEFDPGSGKIKQIAPGEFPGTMTQDREGSFWVPTLQGLLRINAGKHRFSIRRDLESNIGSIVQDGSTNIWLLSSPDDKFEMLVSGLDTVFRVHKIVHKAHDQMGFFSLFLDAQRGVWLAVGSQLAKLNNEAQTFDLIPVDDNFSAPIRALFDSEGSVWLGYWDGVRRLDMKTGIIEKLPSFPQTYVYAFLEDCDKNIWVGSREGLSRYNLQSAKLDVFYNKDNDTKSLSNDTVYELELAKDGTIWIGTASGLNKIVKGTAASDSPRFERWSSNDSELPNDNVYAIVDGGDGTLWLTCGNMISHFSPDKNAFRNFNVGDGLSGSDFKGMANLPGDGIRTKSGHILFGSSDGLVVFHPDNIQFNPYVPPVMITQFSIHGDSRFASDSATMGVARNNLSAAYSRSIVLNHNQNDFTFQFSTLSYLYPENNQYRYKLEPLESEWIQTDARNRIARYTNLDPGEYTFRVIGSNNDGIWNDEGATLTILIHPPWWQTWWAYTLYALAIATLFIYWRNYELKRLRLKHQADHLRELDAIKTRFFTNISHEFRTPITLIHGPLKEMYSKAPDEENRSIIGSMLRNAKRLSRLINQLLDLNKLEAGKMTLHASPVELVQFLREISASYESLARSKNMKYSFTPEVAELIVYIDAEKIEKVVHNVLSNAFKFTDEGGEVILYMRAEGKHCKISVKDTGIGIPADQIKKVFDRFYQVDSSQTRAYEGSGLGMAMAKELVELHHGTIGVESVEGKGTTFTVRLPLGKEHLTKDQIVDKPNLKLSETHNEDIAIADNIPVSERETVVGSEDQSILLIVEDNADMRHYIRKSFSGQYKIMEATDGKAGIIKAKEVIPDLIISDVMMPQMDGYKFCQHIKSNELTSHVPVILLTAKADQQSKLTGLETGADDYLSKPFDTDELKLIVRNRITQRRKIRERFTREIKLEPKQIAITSFDEKFLNRVLAIIEARMGDEDFSIDELSREAGYSNMHFYRKIKALAGVPPSLFLRTIRLKRAAALLRAKSDNVTQIAYSVGFNSLSHFNKCFKEEFGVTPGLYSEKSSSSDV